MTRAYYSTMYHYNLTDEELNDLIKDAVRSCSPNRGAVQALLPPPRWRRHTSVGYVERH